ncbi:MAG TPA: 16S rRNA (adenine(1518)-N(6)/adenine(1519)-N(6))-dimethyltransferase RsmA [Thiotrichales bacterium]|nr:16S rRNA (adenine(1518)-N(6)/adenine(1519)-N(6))-dimethyltransferase RsmA [Thiotrichales bacterium]
MPPNDTPRPRKRLGQHFLHDPRIIERILKAIHPDPDEVFMEIGPGPGALTFPLLARVDRLHVVEIDRDLAAALEARPEAAEGRLVVHRRDALKTDFRALVPGHDGLRIVGNLPYNISTPLLFHLFEQKAGIRDMHFMLQKEVVDRMAARPGSRTYGRLSVMSQYHCRITPLFDIGPGAFRPPPKVHSTFVRLVPRPTPPVEVVDERCFDTVVRQAFSQRRKTLRNALRSLLDAARIAEAGIDPGVRAEALDLDAFARLANAVATASREAP